MNLPIQALKITPKVYLGLGLLGAFLFYKVTSSKLGKSAEILGNGISDVLEVSGESLNVVSNPVRAIGLLLDTNKANADALNQFEGNAEAMAEKAKELLEDGHDDQGRVFSQEDREFLLKISGQV